MKCPVCYAEMKERSYIHTSDEGLPCNLPSKNVPYYLCIKCQLNEKPSLAFYRTLVDEKWYYFDEGKWNYLKKEEFNPSKRKV